MNSRHSRTGTADRPQQILGRYVLFGELASGGMATVHLGRLLGPAGFTKTVAIKRLHSQFAREQEFVSMFLDEARLAARIQHPNVVATLDVVPLQGEIYLIMDYVEGESLSRLLKAAAQRNDTVDPAIAVAILCGTLQGLHAAHDAKDDRGRPLGIVHRDVSPQNVLVGADGIPRVLDFGVAKARGRLHSSREGQLKGKLPYMAPEQVHGLAIDRRTDVYAASVMLWEALTGKRLVGGDNEAAVIANVVKGNFERPSQVARWVTPALDAIVMRGLEADPARRFQTAREMAIALDRAVDGAAPTYEVSEWVQRLAGRALALRATRVREMESSSAVRSIEAQRNLAPPLPATAVAPPPVPPPPAGPPQRVSQPQRASLPPIPGRRSVPPPLDARPTTRVAAPEAETTISASEFDVIASEALSTLPPSAPPPAPLPQGPPPAHHFARFAMLAVGVATIIALAAWWLERQAGAPEGASEIHIYEVMAPQHKPEPPATTVPARPSATAAAAAPVAQQPEPQLQAEPRAEAQAVQQPEAQPEVQPEQAMPSTATETPTTKPGGGATAPPTSAAAPRARAKDLQPKVSCDPPFYIDAENLKRFKPECL